MGQAETPLGKQRMDGGVQTSVYVCLCVMGGVVGLEGERWDESRVGKRSRGDSGGC